MGYQKVVNLLGNTPNQPSKFKTKDWVEINDDSHGTYNTNSEIKFKTSILKSILCDYSDAYIIVKRTIIVASVGATAALTATVRENKQAILENCALFTDSIKEINYRQLGNAKDLDVLMSVCNLVESSYNYLQR